MIAPFIMLFINLAWGIRLGNVGVQEPGAGWVWAPPRTGQVVLGELQSPLLLPGRWGNDPAEEWKVALSVGAVRPRCPPHPNLLPPRASSSCL